MNIRFVVFLTLLIIQACGQKSLENASPTFGGAFFSDENEITAYLHSDPTGELVSFGSGWTYLGKDSIPGIKRELTEFRDGELLDLPHRLTFANHSFWYRNTLDLQPGILWIDADDGAQVWIDGTQIRRSPDGEFFPILDSGKVEVTIRAVNNAMAGGLRKVTWMSQSDFESWEKEKTTIRDSILVGRKAALILDLGISSKLKDLSLAEKKNLLADYPILMTEPVMILGTDGNYYVRWVSEKPGVAKLLFSDGSKKELVSEDGVFSFESLETELAFRLYQEKSNFGDFSFTLPNPDSDLKIAVWGDSQGGWNTFHQIASQIQTHQPDLSIGAGDLVNNGSDEFAYPRFLQKLSLMRTPQLLVPGNHDYDGFYEDLDPVLMKNFLFREGKPTYGMHVLGPLAVITLDPNEHFPVSIPGGTPQRTWFEEAIESEVWKASMWKMIVLHQPPYSQGWPDYHGEKSIQELLEPYFHRGMVDVVVAGHTHDYERLTRDFSGNAVTFLVVGGAGGGLEPEGKNSEFPQMDKLVKKHHFGILEVKKDSLDWAVYGVNGEALDRVTIGR